MDSIIEKDVTDKVKKWREQQKALSLGGLFKSIVDSDTRRDFKKALFMRDKKHSISNPFLVSGWSTSRDIKSGAFGLDIDEEVDEEVDVITGEKTGRATLKKDEFGKKKRAEIEDAIKAEYKILSERAENDASELDDIKSINKDIAKDKFKTFRDS